MIESMKKEMRKITLALGMLLCMVTIARENVNVEAPRTTRSGGSSDKMKFGSDCDPATQSADLDINNVRTKILNGGDMWWDLNAAKYEIPKIEDLNSVRKNSLFSGAIWIGGEDLGGNLRLAAMTYRQRGSDFWPGPLDPTTANTSNSVCEKWDKIFKVDGKNIIEWATGLVAEPADQLYDWPGQGPSDVYPLAPYKDVDGNGYYTPSGGDYPILREQCQGVSIPNEAVDQPDQMLWWIYNDKGNVHSETQGDPIGVEMQTTAFAFATNDEINDMTFYTTRITNRGATKLVNTYFGQWVDADLGFYNDDYVGCDVGLSLGYCYNGDDNDEGVTGYGLNPPSVGVDFFEGPTAKVLENGVLVERELGMSKFVYYNNDANTVNGNPSLATDFYNYLQGKWRTGTDILYGGDGIVGTDGTKADWMFPGDTDPTHNKKMWNEKEAGNSPADRRFIQSSGPFELEPGSVQKLTVGVVWARAPFGGASGSLDLLKEASKKAQQLFNSCFDLIDGPDAPDVEVHEQDQQIVLSLGNTNSRFVENFRDTIINGLNQQEIFTFQGYRVFQLKNGGVSLSELDDLSKAREIFQCDLTDNFETLVNSEFKAEVGASIPVLKVRGNNDGLVHTIRVKEDEFATGSDKTLVNFKTYYYIVLSYAAGNSQTSPYLGGRRVQKFSASPHKLAPKFGGSAAPSFYGDGPELIRLSGKGNGFNNLELTQETKDEILRDGISLNPKYENGHGPIDIKVIDPLKVPKGNFELSLIPYRGQAITGSEDTLPASRVSWKLERMETGDIIEGDTAISYKNEQIILESTTGKSIFDWGLAVTVEQIAAPGRNSALYPQNGLIDWSVTFSDPSNEWLTAVSDQDVTQARQFGAYDWIRSGLQGANTNFNEPSWHDYSANIGSIDRGAAYERIWDGRIAPNRLVSRTAKVDPTRPPARPLNLEQPFTFGYDFPASIYLQYLSNVDIVITPDESKWTECIMIEMGEDPGLNQGGAQKFDMRKGVLNYNGKDLPEGRTIFPGYAINLNTGERMNIIIGEDSYLRSENGRDMKWNPTDDAGFVGGALYPKFGGRHFIYVMGSHQGVVKSKHPKLPETGMAYDKGNSYYDIFNTIVPTMTEEKRYEALTRIYQNCDWVIPTYLALGKNMKENASGIPVPENEVTIKLRVALPYGRTPATVDVNEGLPKYKFNTDDIYNNVNSETGKKALVDLANIVPNPYYAYSTYETSAIDNRVKFTNLPPKCDISIYTLDGSLVRRIKKDDLSTETDWNLKNGAGVPIASGMYIIHIDAGELGEKILKWMGVMRELDLDSF